MNFEYIIREFLDNEDYNNEENNNRDIASKFVNDIIKNK